ncbi:hypothetical protein L7F22_030091 [Adiantum nelumboides]|nr:hypothetical protein [Adiantum nelumboides]
MEGPMSRLWASSYSSSSSSGALRWRLSTPTCATAGDARHSSSANEEQPSELRFPFKAACTAGILALLGDTVAQLRSRWILHQDTLNQPTDVRTETTSKKTLEGYDWLRALRMTSYGFFIYGPSSQIWYNFLDHILRDKTLTNLSLKAPTSASVSHLAVTEEEVAEEPLTLDSASLE